VVNERYADAALICDEIEVPRVRVSLRLRLMPAEVALKERNSDQNKTVKSALTLLFICIYAQAIELEVLRLGQEIEYTEEKSYNEVTLKPTEHAKFISA